jgi:hypothetical protein
MNSDGDIVCPQSRTHVAPFSGGAFRLSDVNTRDLAPPYHQPITQFLEKSRMRRNLNEPMIDANCQSYFQITGLEIPFTVSNILH